MTIHEWLSSKALLTVVEYVQEHASSERSEVTTFGNMMAL